MQGQTISAMQCTRSLKQPGVCYLLVSSQKICEALQHQRHGTAIQACHEACSMSPVPLQGLHWCQAGRVEQSVERSC